MTSPSGTGARAVRLVSLGSWRATPTRALVTSSLASEGCVLLLLVGAAPGKSRILRPSVCALVATIAPLLSNPCGLAPVARSGGNLDDRGHVGPGARQAGLGGASAACPPTAGQVLRPYPTWAPMYAATADAYRFLSMNPTLQNAGFTRRATCCNFSGSLPKSDC